MPDEEVPVVESTEEPVEEAEEIEAGDEPVEDSDLNAADLKEAKNLFKLLKDPETQKQVIQMLANKAGLLEGTPTRPEVAANKRELKDIVRNALGPQYAFMSEALTRVMEEVLNEERTQRAGETQHLHQAQVDSEVESAFTRLSRETNGKSNQADIRNKMVALTDQLNPSPQLSTFEYMKLLYQVANSDKSAASARAQMADKINRNARDAPSRLQSTSTGKASAPAAAPEKRGVRAAVQFALAQMNKDK